MESHSISPGTVSTAINTSNYQYDVFLNHRGCDTKKNFTGHLYRALRSCGIRVFLDMEELQAGEGFSDEIKAVIKNTAVHLAIFSENYANSYWCLHELVLMVESGAIIIPVFFKNVEPDHVQGITESRENEQNGNRADRESEFARGFSSLKNTKDNGRWRYGDQTIRKWREALLKVSNKDGLELKAFNGYEAELVEKIVQNVLERLNRSPFYVPKYEVGLDEKVEDFREKVLSQRQQNGKLRVVGIVGFGGVGKTTLANKFFRIKSPAYRNSCFFSVSGNGCITPLHNSFEKRMPHLDPSPKSVSVVKNLLMSEPSLANNPSLVILDGLDNVQMREDFLEIQDFLHSKSLILITARDKEVLRCSEVKETDIYTLDGLNTPCSRKLFCFHAFHDAAPLQGYEYLVAWFLRVCKGSPLLLRLLGSLLSGNNDRFSWEDLLDRFQQIRSDKIQEKLEVIYDKLGKEEQQTFLNIVRENLGRDADDALNCWKVLGRKGTWFQILLEKRLVEVDSKGRIHMHDLLKEFGEKIAKETKFPLLFPFVSALASILYRLSTSFFCTVLFLKSFFKTRTLIAKRNAWIYAYDQYYSGNDYVDDDLEYAARTLNNLKLNMQSPDLFHPKSDMAFLVKAGSSYAKKSRNLQFCNNAHYRAHICMLYWHNIRKSFSTHHVKVRSSCHLIGMRCDANCTCWLLIQCLTKTNYNAIL